jgi:hypothetical protein
MFNDAANHPKLQGLPSAVFKGWFNVLCVASIHDGTVPEVSELARWLHVRPYRAQALIDRLIAERLVDQEDGRLRIHNWSKWQAPHRLVRPDGGNPPNAPKSVQAFPANSTASPLQKEREKGKRAFQNEGGRSQQHSTSRKRRDAHSAWEREVARTLGPHYARAIDRLAADPALVDRITAAEMREPGSGVMMALTALKELEMAAGPSR